MIVIAHRGNLSGPNPQLENTIDYINHAMSIGYDVEIDLWWHKDSFFLGHDSPQWKLEDNSIFCNGKTWCHAKNLESFERLLMIKNCNSFWHQNDDVTLTSMGFVWTLPGKNLIHNSICVVNENIISKDYYHEISKKCYAVCSDYASILKDYEK